MLYEIRSMFEILDTHEMGRGVFAAKVFPAGFRFSVELDAVRDKGLSYLQSHDCSTRCVAVVLTVCGSDADCVWQ
jgi:hypothetical protein